jgi:phospholipase C
VSNRVYDHTSILRMIEQRWGLPSLSVRDAAANDLGRELFPHRHSKAVPIDVPQGPFGGACPAPAAASAGAAVARSAGEGASEWKPLLDLARRTGWPV